MKRVLVTLMIAALLTLGLASVASAHGSTPPPVCYGDCPTNQVFTADRFVCPSGYSHVSTQHPGYCYKGGSPDWPDDYKLGTTETFTVTFDYGKSSDPSKCHRPAGSSLGVPSWAMSEFNSDFDEWVNAPSGPQYCPTPTNTPVTPTATNTPVTPTATPETPTATPETPTATPETPTATPETPTVTPDPCENGGCVTPTPVPTEHPKKRECVADERIWVWDLFDANGVKHQLRDRGYDGTYDSPGRGQQCFYFGCDFIAVKAWGHWVNDCELAEYDYWNNLPQYNGGGKCQLP
jgi:hypothetical protein